MLNKVFVPKAIALCVLASTIGLPPAAAQDGELSFNTGLNHLRDGRIELAIKAFKEAIDGDDKNPYFYKGLGLAYLRADKYNDAIKAFRKALDLSPYYVDVRNDLGTALVLSGDRAEGKSQFLKAFNDPQNTIPEIAARNLGRAFMEEGNYEQALGWFRTAAERNPAYSLAHIGIADVLASTGRLDEAVLELEIAEKVAPKDPELLLALGQAYFNTGRFTEARTKLEGVSASDPAGPFGRRAVELLQRFPQ
jgi:Flp pilus assembly protein TadD